MRRMTDRYTFHKGDINAIVCESFSDCYHALNEYIVNEGVRTDSRVGPTFETLNFKTTILNPIYRCTISQNRNSNIFFHLAESLWVLAGRNDLEFINTFNSKIRDYSDDSLTLHGAYGKRLRRWSSNDTTIDQLRKITSLLNSDPDLRRSVISLWDPALDLGNPSKDIPCNTQLVLRVKDEDMYLTIFNRSNDLHWGYVANIFQFSFLGEVISMLIGKKFAKQTHISQSLHVYTNNKLIDSLIKSDIHEHFYSLYHSAPLQFNFRNPINNFEERFTEFDITTNTVIEIILRSIRVSIEPIEQIIEKINNLKKVSQTMFEITFYLLLFIRYKKELTLSSDVNKLRVQYANYLLDQNQVNAFWHKDYFSLALNYFVRRMTKGTQVHYTVKDPYMGQY
jgi:thymidylate synthase